MKPHTNGGGCTSEAHTNAGGCTGEGAATPGVSSGFLTLIQTGELVFLTEVDCSAALAPIVGVWVSGIECAQAVGICSTPGEVCSVCTCQGGQESNV